MYNYAVSAPWRKVRANEEVLLAWEMNGEPLPKIHGAPLRVVVTGYIGARSCKWVYRINALSEPSFGPVQRQEYLYYSQQVGVSNFTFLLAKGTNFADLDRKAERPRQQWFLHPGDAGIVRAASHT